MRATLEDGDLWDRLERSVPHHCPEPVPLDELTRSGAPPVLPAWLEWSLNVG